MKYWHYLVLWILAGISLPVGILSVYFKNECIRYGQPSVCLINKPIKSTGPGWKGGTSINIPFVLEDKGKVIQRGNGLTGEAKEYGLPLVGLFYRCYSIDMDSLSPYLRYSKWMNDPFTLSYGDIETLDREHGILDSSLRYF